MTILGCVSKDEIAAAVEQIITEGITARCQAFTIEWVAEMRDDVEVAFDEASARPGGVVPRALSGTTSRCIRSRCAGSSTS